jgi:hypothetical protein
MDWGSAEAALQETEKTKESYKESYKGRHPPRRVAPSVEHPPWWKPRPALREGEGGVAGNDASEPATAGERNASAQPMKLFLLDIPPL